MKVIVCGAGQVGYNIARHLSNQQNDVTVIDRSADLIRRVTETLDVQAIQGYASDPDLLDQANAKDADMIIAVTHSDEVNMVACQVAHTLFDVPTKIARVRNQSYLDPAWQQLFSRDHMPIDVIISPEVEVARAVARRLQLPGAFEVVPFANNRVQVIGTRIREGCPVVDTPLRQLTELFPNLHLTIMSIIRNHKLFVPNGDDQILNGDSIFFAVQADQARRALVAFGHDEKEAERVVIIGGGNIGLFLARELEKTEHQQSIKIIEHNPERAELVASRLNRTTVISGDALDTEILNEANVAAADTVIAVANDDEVNILSSILSKQAGAERSITLINNPIYGPLMASLGVDVYVDPRETTVSTIIRHIRRGRIRGLFTVRAGEAEVIEAELMEQSTLVGSKLNEIDLPNGAIVGAVVRADEVIMPRGDLEFEAGDRVVLFAKSDVVRKVEQLFTVRIDFF
ncbi:MAG: Trk system potassium transporter TrkA [Sphingomonadales bacterium]|nr:Trk system potassium transporter TrkA [Sphingomonadales bacterium]